MQGNEAIDYLNDFSNQTLPMIVGSFVSVPPEQMNTFIQNLETALSQIDNQVTNIRNHMQQTRTTMSKLTYNSKREKQAQTDFPPQQPMEQPMGDPMAENLGMEGIQPQSESLPVMNSHIDVFNFIESQLQSGSDVNSIRDAFLNSVSNENTVTETGEEINPAQVIADSMQRYLDAINNQDDELKAEIAKDIYDVLPVKSDYEEIDVTPENLSEQVTASSKEIVKMAKRFADFYIKNNEKLEKEANEKSFNLKKFAQHKAMENNVIFGPGQVSTDAFTGKIISDWHLSERNKGFGLRIDDIINIDYERIWRNTIMDKYYPTYLDLEGNIAGGYIEDRFEVDRNIPESSNMHLASGQKRKPYIPGLKSTEARLQNLRSKEDPRGRIFNNSDKPYDWSKDDFSSTSAAPLKKK